MTAESDAARLERQVMDAAKRLHRTSGCPVLIAAAIDVDEGGTGIAFTVHGLTNRQHELAMLILLGRLANDLEPGAAANCPACSAAWARVSAAVAALQPGFGPGADVGGCC